MTSVNYETFRDGNPYLSLLIFIFLITALVAIYFVPSIIAMMRKHPQRWLILLFNIFSGWTGILWVGLFVWSIWPKEHLYQAYHFLGLAKGGSFLGWGPYHEHNTVQAYSKDSSKNEASHRLKQLSELKEGSIITEEEFNAAKARLLKK